MVTWNTAVSAEAWDDLHDEYVDAGGEEAPDRTLANLLRQAMNEVEG